MTTTILSSAAPVRDEQAMREFLAPIPNGDVLGKLLETAGPVSTRAYDDDTSTARFVESDGATVLCFMVTDITIDQAEMIAAECVAMEWGVATFRDAVERALGPDFESAE